MNRWLAVSSKIFLLPLLILLVCCSVGFAKEGKRVLVLYTLDKGHPAHELTDQGIRRIFQSNPSYAVELFREYLDAGRFTEPGHARVAADYLARKYAGSKIDAIITVYPQAAEFLLARRSTLFRGIPLVAAEVGQSFYRKLEKSPARRFVTGHIIGDNAAGILDTILRIRPATKRIALVVGTASNDKYSADVLRHSLREYAGKTFELVELAGLPMKEILVRVSSLPEDSVVFYAGILRDSEGKTFVPREALSQIAAASSVPVFGLYDSFVGYGIVGGPLISFEQAGNSAANLILKVLSGEPPEAIPFVRDTSYTTIFDWRELKRWQIPESVLPPGSTLVNREFSVWRAYKWHIAGIVAFSIMETLLVALLVVHLRRSRRAREALAESEMRYRTVADYTYDWEYWSAPDGKFFYISPSCERITGYAPERFIENPSLMREIIVPEDKPIWDEHYRNPAQEISSQEIHFRIRSRDGRVRWLDHISQQVIDSQGLFRGVRASTRDVTERREAELEVQQHRAELAHVMRVAVMGELTSSLAHELNQPLAAILNYANAARRFLSADEPDLDRAREALKGITRDDKRAGEVIRKVRNMLKRDDPSYVALDINNIVQETVALVGWDLSFKGASVTMDLARDLEPVMGDRVQLQQVLLNLVMNAVVAMRGIEPELRKLVIKTDKHEERSIRVSVSDTGHGIAEAQRHLIFEPFYTTKRLGLGMGLAISQRIINAFGGAIWAENDPHGGATVSFTIPVVVAGENRGDETIVRKPGAGAIYE